MISKKEYSTIVKNNSPKSKCFVNGTKAFFIGGFICLIGQVLTDCYSMLDLSKDDAIEFKSEGYVAGLGAKLFIIAGPVIVYGVTASVVFGAVLWVLHMFGITLF